MGGKKSSRKSLPTEPRVDVNKFMQKALDDAQNKRPKQEQSKQKNKPQEELNPVTPKYYLTNEVVDIDGHKLHRIQAARDIPEIGVQEGDLGGFIESERNLSHNGTCWVFAGNVYEQAVVTGGATVRGTEVKVHDYAVLADGFAAYDEAHLHGHFRGAGCAKAAGRADAGDYAIMKGSSYLTDGAIMRGRTILGGNSRAAGSTIMTKTAEFCGNFESFGGHYMNGVMGRSADDYKKPEAPNISQDKSR